MDGWMDRYIDEEDIYMMVINNSIGKKHEIRLILFNNEKINK